MYYYNTLELYSDNGKENGNYYGMLGFYRYNGKENGSYCSMFFFLGGGPFLDVGPAFDLPLRPW